MSVNTWQSVNTWGGAVAPPVVAVELESLIPTRFAKIGNSFTFDISIYFGGTETPFTYALTGNLPAGLSFNTSTGVISGTSTAEDIQELSITATDTAANTATSNTFEIRSGNAIVIPETERTTPQKAVTYLKTQGFEGSVNDALYEWLGQEGHTGSLGDRWVSYWSSLGFSGSYNDMLSTWRNQ